MKANDEHTVINIQCIVSSSTQIALISYPIEESIFDSDVLSI